jgi:predicted DNA-binding transcriptional regulator AlpA
MTTEDVAHKCGVSLSDFYRMVCRGEVSVPVKTGRSYIWTADDLLRAMAQGRMRKAEDRRTLAGRMSYALRTITKAN